MSEDLANISMPQKWKNTETNGIELLTIRQISRAESQLKSFHCVSKFENKVESTEFGKMNLESRVNGICLKKMTRI